MAEQVPLPSANPLRKKLFTIIFGHRTKSGKLFDLILLVLIIVSVLAVTMESVPSLQRRYSTWFYVLDWTVTILFTIEYVIRIYCVRKPWQYILSFYGIVDLLSILPTYLSVFFVGTQYLLVIRILRLLRVFRVLKLTPYMIESEVLSRALRASRRKITVFLYAILSIVVIVGSVMYVIEGPVNSTFSSIPRGVYWAIVTLTTVGYGDITPITALGQFFSAILMILGYAIIAVPTGIVTVEMSEAMRKTELERDGTEEVTVEGERLCSGCKSLGHQADARFCRVCGHTLPLA